MRSKFFRNLASFDSIDKMRLSRLSDSCKIYHIYAHNSLKVINKLGLRAGWSVRHLDFLCGVQTSPIRLRTSIRVPRAVCDHKFLQIYCEISPEGRRGDLVLRTPSKADTKRAKATIMSISHRGG